MAAFKEYCLEKSIEEKLGTEIDQIAFLCENEQQLVEFMGSLKRWLGWGQQQQPQQVPAQQYPTAMDKMAPGFLGKPSDTGPFISEKDKEMVRKFDVMKSNIIDGFKNLFAKLQNHHSKDKWEYSVINNLLQMIKPYVQQAISKIASQRGNVGRGKKMKPYNMPNKKDAELYPMTY